MKILDRLERFVAKFAVKDLMKYIMMGSFLVFVVDLFSNNLLSTLLYFNRDAILAGQVWRIFTFIFVPESGSWLLVISLFFYFYIGRVLEMTWGTARFNLYYLLGLIFTIVGGFVMGFTTTTYLNMTLFFAYAATYPDSLVNIYFILPVRVKYLGYFSAAILVFNFFTADLTGKVIIGISVLNFILFFGPRLMRDSQRRSKTQQMRRNIEAAHINTKIATIHMCTTCGITERDDPNMEFRYCSTCEGSYEYCMNHIRNHEHKVKVIQLEDRRSSEGRS
ncbi:hypothetical protein KCG48_05150 [Proteiniclasticum sp. BAD-10]|uniref:Peptidase S54 rhomboid domain-containing protein n=1 Tax=Proteiniclasticum sediminis TaxID=2804028 RepID=A0A941HQQ1_9CLOT|nr:rhomboid family intramembrane serine protease [Proteiniclasticum sediminis]MBR0575728.1 hypothetical protein [Proteiniclasticum sediminis]